MKVNRQMLEVIAGGLIIAVAFAMMLPGFALYAISLWRIGLLVILTLLVAWALTFALAKLTAINKAKSNSNNAAQSSKEKS